MGPKQIYDTGILYHSVTCAREERRLLLWFRDGDVQVSAVLGITPGHGQACLVVEESHGLAFDHAIVLALGLDRLEVAG